jgi:predicted transcriptional regulator
MVHNHLLEIKKNELLKEIARWLLLNENSYLDQTISQICQRLGISYEVVESFVNYLYRHNLLVKYERGQKYSLTLNGVNFLLNLVESFYFTQDLKGEDDGHTGN